MNLTQIINQKFIGGGGKRKFRGGRVKSVRIDKSPLKLNISEEEATDPLIIYVDSPLIELLIKFINKHYFHSVVDTNVKLTLFIFRKMTRKSDLTKC